MFEFIASAHPLMFNIAALVLSLLIVIKAADLLTFGISNYARKFGISDYLVGFLVLAIGTSLPALVSSFMGGSVGSSGIVLGTLFGSGVITLTFVLGCTAIAAKKLDVKTRLLGKSTYFIMLMILLPMVMLLDKKISRLDGILLIVVFFAYIAGLWKKEGTFGHLKKHVRIKQLWKDVFVFLGALVALLLGARFLVFSSVVISQEIGISSYVTALIVIGLGASLPDLTVELKALKKGHAGIGFGNILGGITAEMLLILGLVAVFYPVSIAGIGLASLISTIVFFLIGISLVLFWVRKNTLFRWQGFVLLGMYLAFVAVQVLLEIF